MADFILNQQLTGGMTKKTAILRLLLLLLLLQQLTVVSLPAATRVFLCSRLEFTPALLDMLRRSFSRKLGRAATIILQPVENLANVARDASGSLLLIENGMENSLLPEDYVAVMHLDLVWAMVASLRMPGLSLDQSLDGEQFVTLLRELKRQAPDRYPWFESLNSRVTLRNFDLLFNSAAIQAGVSTESVAGADQKKLWLQPDAIIYLYQAIEEHLLNPFSIEADLGLAMNVFEADDAWFVSQWVPADFLGDDRLCRENLGKVRLLPLPIFNNTKYPRLRLCLYGPPSAGFKSLEDVCRPTDENFIDLDYQADMEWIEKKSADKYDALIMGGF